MDAINRLLELDSLGIKLGLNNIKTLCSALGNPQNSFHAITVAGTNGKGSVSAILDSSLRAASYRSGRFTSPHLISIEERFVVDGTPVNHDHLREVTSDVFSVADQLYADGRLLVRPTFFETTTAIAFEIFKRAKVDVSILEVGLGGRFDATCVANPIATAITSIELDHEQYLGNTHEQIAFEKSGIIKQGTMVITGNMSAECLEIIRNVSHEKQARLCPASDGVKMAVKLERGQTLLELETPIRRYGTIPLALSGQHQAENALIAVRLLEELESVGFPVSQKAIAHGLATVEWPGRLQLLSFGDQRELLLDGAHNPAAAAALSAYLREIYPNKVTLIFGAMRDKKTLKMLEQLIPNVDKLIITQSKSPKAAPAKDLVAQAKQLGAKMPISVETRLDRAVHEALSPGRTACATGSLYLIGELLQLVKLLK